VRTRRLTLLSAIIFSMRSLVIASLSDGGGLRRRTDEAGVWGSCSAAAEESARTSIDATAIISQSSPSSPKITEIERRRGRSNAPSLGNRERVVLNSIAFHYCLLFVRAHPTAEHMREKREYWATE